MNKVKVKLNFIRITPMKMNRIAKLIRGKIANEAIIVLQFSTLSASLPLRKLLNSAIANYKTKYNKEDLEKIFISEILVNNGPTYKRMRPRARGMGARILKRSCHVELTISEIIEKKKQISNKKITDIKESKSKDTNIKKSKTNSTKPKSSKKPEDKAKKKLSNNKKSSQNSVKKVDKKTENKEKVIKKGDKK